MKTWWVVVFSIAISLLGAGIIFLVSSQPRGKPVELLPPPTKSPITVHISGAVLKPGVYTLPAGSRVKDGISAAGGTIEDANLETVNLAAFLEDGSKIQIPFLANEAKETSHNQSTTSTTEKAQSNSPTNQKININTASQTELESLPGIGPVTAQKIIAYREENGSFETVEAIQNVAGIGPATFDKIEDFITVK